MVFTAQYCVSVRLKCINKYNLSRKQQFVRDYCANKLQAPILVWLLRDYLGIFSRWLLRVMTF